MPTFIVTVNVQPPAGGPAVNANLSATVEAADALSALDAAKASIAQTLAALGVKPAA